MSFILGLHAGHNASACIGDRSGVIFAIQEERLVGEKNYWGYPVNSIAACLKQVGGTAADLGCVSYGGNQVFCKYHSRDDVLKAYRRQQSIIGRMRQRIAVPLLIALHPNLGVEELRGHLEKQGLDKVPRIHNDHHYTHAATAYYGLREDPKKPYLVLTCDGDGDGLCGSIRVMGGGRDELIATSAWDNSLGALYSWVTFSLGFMPLEHEYKLMGMAPYASAAAAARMAKVFESYLGLDESGLSFMRRTFRRTNDLYNSLQTDFKGKRFDHICAGLQLFTENLLCKWISNAIRVTGVHDVLAAGGVFMNVKANKLIANLPSVQSFQAFPSCGDETLSIGAYYLEAARLYGKDEVAPLKDFYLGDAPSEADIAAELAKSDLAYHKPQDLPAEVADLLVAGHPVARCAGPMEFGARALGNRSILADPKNQDVVRVINRMVKNRDFWMPFAPMLIAERHDEYVQNPKKVQNPFMMMSFDTKDNFRDLIAAVHNADLTCRTQMLSEHQNPEMYRILQEFAQRTGRAVVLNTSFNLHGFPIVRTAQEALHVMHNSGLEHLQLGPYLVRKKV